MATSVRRVDYFHTIVRDEPGEAYRLLSLLAGQGVNLLAFTAVPVGPAQTQLTLFADDPGKLRHEAGGARMHLDGPYPAFLLQGDDRIGALAELHEKLYTEGVNVFASTGVSDGKGDFGYVVYVRPEHVEKAAKALGI